MALWFTLFAVYAAAAAMFTSGDDQVWGDWATAGYATAAVVFWLSRSASAGLLVGVAGALAAPLAWLSTHAPPTADVEVVGRSAVLLLRHGTPYLPLTQLTTWRSYNPYLPAMSAFGLPRALGLPGLLGNPGVWQSLAAVSLFAVAFRIAAPHRAGECQGCRSIAFRGALFAAASPVVAFPLTLGITDPPVLALLCLALAIAAHPARSAQTGLVLGVACAMKITAWPAVPVLAAMLAARDGARPALRMTGAAAGVAALLTALTAPDLPAHPSALVQNVLLFPLGMTAHRTPAQSPLPGHLLAGIGPAAHLAAVGLLLAVGLALAVSVIARPPRGARPAARRLALGLSLMFALAPAARFGYFAYPLGLLGWVRLTRPDAPGAEPSGGQADRGASAADHGDPGAVGLALP